MQETFGYLDTQALRYVAISLRVPLSRAYGVATFYHFFTLKPAGEHTCVVCMGTACYIKGAPAVARSALQHDLGIKPGETTADGKGLLLTARCLGSCGLAPAVVYDHDVAGKVSSTDLRERLKKWTRMTPEELEQIAEDERATQSTVRPSRERLRGRGLHFLPEPERQRRSR